MIGQAEELFMNTWPALLYDGWILRFANGCTRQTNSIQPLYFSAQNIEEKPHLQRVLPRSSCPSSYASPRGGLAKTRC